MAAMKGLPCVLVHMCIGICLVHVGSFEGTGVRSEPRVSSIVFNNPKLLSHQEEYDYDGYSIDSEQEAPDPQKLGGVVIQDEAKKLASKFRTLSNDELGVLKMQSIYDNLPYQEVVPSYEKKLKKIGEDIEEKLNQYLTVLKTNKIMVEKLYTYHSQQPPITHSYDCCSMPKSQLSYDSQYQCDVSRETTCDLLPQYLPHNAFNPGRNLTEVFQHITISSVKWQYFISKEGVHNEFPAHDFGSELPYSSCKDKTDLRHRMAYFSTIYPKRKNIVIMVDHGNSLSANQLSTTKAIVNYIINSLSQHDRVGIIGVAAAASYAQDSGCLSSTLSPLTFEAKLYLGKFVEGLSKEPTAANHSLGFQQAFQMLWTTLAPDGKRIEEDESAMIIYVSRGLLSSLTEAKEVLETIAEGNGRMQHRVVISTYAVIDDGKPIMYEKTFLQDLANQDFGKYAVEAHFATTPPRGDMVPVSSSTDLSVTVGDFASVLRLPVATVPQVSAPTRQHGDGVSLSITWPCFHDNGMGGGGGGTEGGELIGVVGMDIFLGALMEGVTYFSGGGGGEDMDVRGGGAYVFVVDRKGNTIMHPSLERPSKTNVQPMQTDISHFEKYASFDTIRKQILRQKNSSATFEMTASDSDDDDNDNYILQQKVTRITYRWKRLTVKQLESSPLIVVIKIVENGLRSKKLGDVTASQQSTLVYHRLDLLPTDQTCMHLKQLATKESSALFLSARAYNTPFQHLSQEETKRRVKIYLAYLNDNTGLLRNPGLKENIRSDVSATQQISNDWLLRVKYMSSVEKQHIVRRYVATPSGVMHMYPGTQLDPSYDPARRPWYRNAQAYPGRVVLTAPYLDAGGAGFVVTVSHTIYQGRSASLHGPYDRIEAVMGMDIPLGYFYKLIIQQMPVCEKQNIRCFIMDNQGYLIAHQGLIEPNGKGPQEQEHLTRKEPLVANDIVHHKEFVHKRLCNSYNDRTIQRYYHFNSSVQGVLTNLIHVEPLSHYQVTAIPGTNAFVGIVNETNNMVFCPCSMVDRLCLNCHRMEQTECECPCECPLAFDFCTGNLVDTDDTNPSCDTAPEPVKVVEVPEETRQNLHQCFHSKCDSITSRIECLGVVDCEWCALEHDGMEPLERPFCGTQRMCFAGVLGAETPYDDGQPVHEMELDDPAILKSTPVGPVAGGIMGCFLLLALGVYCYRHHVHRTAHHYVTSSNPDNQLRVAGDDINDELDSPEEMVSGLTNIVLASFENPASVSPYRVNTTYRRAPNAESDLGYSTMTPMEDSEQASTCVEPLIIGRDRYRPPSQASVVKPSSTTPMIPPPPSSRRSVSPPPVNPAPKSFGTDLLPPGQTTLLSPSQTVLPTDSPHRVIAAVQVHMVDSH